MCRGQIVDRLTGLVVYETRTKYTWELAQQAAEREAKRNHRGDRYEVRVV